MHFQVEVFIFTRVETCRGYLVVKQVMEAKGTSQGYTFFLVDS